MGSRRRAEMLGLAVAAAAVSASALMAVTAATWLAPAWSATRAGDAQVINPIDATSGAGQPLTGGATATPFSLRLPEGASCRGDSANDGYRVQSYMVPESVDPATLQFGSVGPLPTGTGSSFRQPLFKSTSERVVNHQTAAATKPPGPGPIVNIPAVNFSVFKPGDVPAGTYNIGVACTRGPASAAQLDTFWNAKLILAPSDGGAGITWRVPGSAAAPSPATSAAGQADTAVTSAAPAEAAGGPATAPRPNAGSGVVNTAVSSKGSPSGAPPSLGLRVTGIAAHVPLAGGSRSALVVWAALLVAGVRAVWLLTRPVPVVAAAAR